MKRCLFFLLMACVCATGLEAQVVYSNSSHAYNSMNSVDSTIVRHAGIVGEGENRYNLVCCHWYGAPGTVSSHRFILQNTQSPEEYAFDMPVEVDLEHGAMADRVTDMCIHDGKCYFCGNRVYVTDIIVLPVVPGEPQVYQMVYDTCAFMGYFTLADMRSGSMRYCFHTIDGMKTARKLTAFQSENDACRKVVSVLGVPSSGVSRTCLAQIYSPACNVYTLQEHWDYFLEYPDNLDEEITDITVTDDYFVTASVFGNDNEIVGFRNIKLSMVEMGLYNFSYSGNGTELYLYDLSQYALDYACGFGGQRLWRYPATPVVLCPNGSGFIAGLSGTGYTESDAGIQIEEGGGAFVFVMEESYYMRQAQSVYVGKDARLDALACLPVRKTVGLLARNWHFSWGSGYDIHSMMQFVDLTKTGLGECYQDTLVYKTEGEVHSIDTCVDRTFSLSGCSSEVETDVPYSAMQSRYNRLNTCIDYHLPDQYMAPTQTISSTETPVVWQFLLDQSEEWEVRYPQVVEIDVQDCYHK